MSQPPRELFAAERPVRSDFARERSYARRRVVTIAVLVLAVGGLIYAFTGHSAPPDPANIPTIAAEGDYRQKPANPGGIDIPHQDVHVYDELEGKNAPPMPPEHLLPPPETPALVPQPPPQPAPPPVVAPAVVEQIVPDPKNEIDETRKIAKPLPTTVAPTVAASPVVEATASKAVVVPTPQPKTAPQAQPRLPIMTLDQIIASTKASAANTKSKAEQNNRTAPGQNATVGGKTAAIVSPPPVAAVPAATVPSHVHEASGNSAIQLASVPDEAKANVVMAELQKKYASTLGGISLHLVRADLGAKGVYYRIQSQGLSTDAASRLCASFKQKNAGCILVRK